MKRPATEELYRVLRAAASPMTAYEILDAVRSKGISAPTTVYRALSRLMRAGLAHRLESMNAYVACAEPEQRHDMAIFAICLDCGRTDEMLERGDHDGQLVWLRIRRAIVELHAVPVGKPN